MSSLSIHGKKHIDILTLVDTPMVRGTAASSAFTTSGVSWNCRTAAAAAATETAEIAAQPKTEMGLRLNQSSAKTSG